MSQECQYTNKILNILVVGHCLLMTSLLNDPGGLMKCGDVTLTANLTTTSWSSNSFSGILADKFTISTGKPLIGYIVK